MARHTPDLKRRRHRREPKQRFVVLCEGESTEPAYFAALERTCSSALIEVEMVAGVGVPYTIARAAVERARALGLARRSRKSLNSFEERDEVWAVFDRDEHPRFNEAVALCQAKGVGVARSDPCFELWLILHDEDYDRPDDRRAVQARLQQLRPEYNRRGAKRPDSDDLVSRVEDAEQRGSVQLVRRQNEGIPYGRPSTTVGDLTRAIREAAKRAR
ncbi:MAG: RloB family protein [Gammaproteobacteria bacterium]